MGEGEEMHQLQLNKVEIPVLVSELQRVIPAHAATGAKPACLPLILQHAPPATGELRLSPCSRSSPLPLT